MIVPEAVNRAYLEWSPYLDRLEERVRDSLEDYCESEGFVFDGRKKDLESVAEKIESGRYRRWLDLDDLYGCRIGVPLFDDEPRVVEEIRERFQVVEERGRGTSIKAPEEFRFDSTRVIAQLKLPPGLHREEERLFQLRFEIQVMSVFQYAWSKTTHALTYKSDLLDWKRFRLAAHLKAAAESADFLLMGFDKAAEFIPEGTWPSITDKASIRSSFVSLAEQGIVPTEAIPKDWSRFADNVYRLFQLADGAWPTGMGRRALSSLDANLTRIENRIRREGGDSFPRSLSLFQVTLACFISEHLINGKRLERYHPPIDASVTDLYPDLSYPGEPFEAA